MASKAKKRRVLGSIPGRGNVAARENVAAADFEAAMGGPGPGLFCVSLVFSADFLALLADSLRGNGQANYLFAAASKTLLEIDKVGPTKEQVVCLFCDHRFRGTKTLGCIALLTPQFHQPDVMGAMCAAVCCKCVEPRQTLPERIIARYGELKLVSGARRVATPVAPGHA